MKYNKYKIQKQQVSHDGGETWVDVSPSYTKIGDYIGTYNTLDNCESGGTPIVNSSSLNVEVTDDMKESLYTLILNDGSYYVRKLEDAEELYWTRNPECVGGEYDITDGKIRLIALRTTWIDNPYQTHDELTDNVKAVVIGNQTDIFNGNLYWGWCNVDYRESFPNAIYCYLCDNVSEVSIDSKYLFGNVKKIRLSKNLKNTDLSLKYLEGELVFKKDGDIIVRCDTNYLDKIIIERSALHSSIRNSAYSYKNVKEILVYGSGSPNYWYVNGRTRLYVPDSELYKYSHSIGLGVFSFSFPLSLYKIKLPIGSGKASVILRDGSLQIIPNDGTTILKSSDFDNLRGPAAYVTVSEGITEIKEIAFRPTAGAITISLPSTLTKFGATSNTYHQTLIFNGVVPPDCPSGIESWYTYVPDSSIMAYAKELIKNKAYGHIENLRKISEYNLEHASDKDYTPKDCSYEYNWALTYDIECVGDNQYYMYKKQKRCINGHTAWEDVIPLELSYDGEGSNSPVIYKECSLECGCQDVGLLVTLNNGTTCTSQCENGIANSCASKGMFVTVDYKECVTAISESYSGLTNLSSVTMTDNVVSLNTTFKNDSALTNVRLSNNLSEIPAYIFQNCENLNNVNIPLHCVTIGSYAFANTNIETEIQFPDGLTTIGTSAFENSKMYNIVLPYTITNIESHAFANNSRLVSVYCYATTPPTLGSMAFSNTALIQIVVPAQSVEAYKNANGWSTYANIIVAL